MNHGDTFPPGCEGALWSNGDPSASYCSGDGGRYPWWAKCCEWADNACRPKPDCSDEPRSMQGGGFPRGCKGAVWSGGDPSASYCSGDGGRYPWWAECCEWVDNACRPKPDCSDEPPSMNGEGFPRGCEGAVWSGGNPSASYCSGDGG